MSERKDRLVQARVPERLESTLKEEARRRRTTVSQMVRTILEDTFDPKKASWRTWTRS